jgi:hypothetical protein
VSRGDFKAKGGRFNTDAETLRMFDGMRGWENAYGDYILYFELNSQQTQYDDVYNEAIGVGRVYNNPIRLPCLHVTHMRGENENGEVGFYYNDDLTATVSSQMFQTSGMILARVDTGEYMRDRLVYDQKVFRVTKLSVLGQIQERDTIISIEATEVKPDELVDDADWSQYTNQPSA